MKPHTHSQRGNALWYILIAIILIGALTILVTRSGSNTSQTADIEQLRIKASQIMRYAKGLEAAIDRMKMRGISENSISFENTTTATNYTNAACTVSDCKLFDTGGGGEQYREPPEGVNDGSEWIFTGANNVGTTANPVGRTAAQTGNDLLMLLPNANSDLCIQINRDLAVGTAGTLPTDASGLVTTAFTGAYANATNLIDGNPTPFELDAKRGGCFINTAPNPDVTYFYWVLLAR